MSNPSISLIREFERNEVTIHIFEGIRQVIAKCQDAVEAAVREGESGEALYWLGQKDALSSVLDAPGQLVLEAKEEELMQ
jgi:hypothetical protein